MLSSISSIASQVVGTCKNLVQKHGSEIATVGKVAISTLLPGGGILAELLEHTCDSIKDKQDELDQKALIQQLESNVINRLGNDSKQFLDILNMLDGKLSDVLDQMVEAKENMNASDENLAKLLLGKIAKSPELMEMKAGISTISSDIKIVQDQNQKILESFIDFKGDMLETLKEQMRLEMSYSPLNQIDGLNQKDAVIYLNADHRFSEAILEKNLTQAKFHLDEMIRLHANSSKTKSNQALIALLEKDFEKSEGLIAQALERDKGNANLTRIKSLANQTTNFVKRPNPNVSVIATPHIKVNQMKQGEIIGNRQWRLISQIGSGGMGMVWSVENRLGKKGALKVLLSGNQDQALIQSFQKEIDTLETINHEGIVKIIDWGEDQVFKIWFMVMELIEGESLASYLLKNAPIDEDQGLMLLKEIAQTLVVCHQNNVVHRDIKPANIMLKNGLKPILIDFGIAKKSNIQNLQQTTTIALTEAYAAPEQRLGDYSHQSDLFALGRTITECFLPRHVPLLSVNNAKRYVPENIWDAIEQLLDDKEHRGDASDLLNRIKKTATDYHYVVAGAESKGPVALLKLVELIVGEKKKSSGDDILVWTNGLSEWVKWETRGEIKVLVDAEMRKNTALPPPVKTNPVMPIVPPKIEQVVTKVWHAGEIRNVVAKGVGFNMVYCPEGEFWMGSDDESPRHQVRMNKGFWMGETQVTQELWQKVMGWNLSLFEDEIIEDESKLPVTWVTWYDCLVFCNKLSELENFKPCFNLTNIELTNIEKDEDFDFLINRNSITKANVEWLRNANGYRLPTEAEWEYSAKAGTELIYSGSNSLDEVAWYEDNSNDTHEVKGKKANAWGLYDMSGNVEEWCMDKYGSDVYKSRGTDIENPILWDNSHCARVARGGSCWHDADGCRVAYRYGFIANDRNVYQGFRLLRCEP